MSQPTSCEQSDCYSFEGAGMEIYVNCCSAGVFENGTAVSKSVCAQNVLRPVYLIQGFPQFLRKH
jgi:hypothetical protein